jgi:Mg-chelatase subunit ChlI
MKNHIFIEGLQGSGKSTLLRKLSQKFPEYKAYYEGDISPAELAWCSYMTKEQYEEVISSCDKYQKYCEKNNIPNGVAEDSIREIHRSYRELLATDGFLKTKC